MRRLHTLGNPKVTGIVLLIYISFYSNFGKFLIHIFDTLEKIMSLSV